jgi:hypothetical protein
MFPAMQPDLGVGVGLRVPHYAAIPLAALRPLPLPPPVSPTGRGSAPPRALNPHAPWRDQWQMLPLSV